MVKSGATEWRVASGSCVRYGASSMYFIRRSTDTLARRIGARRTVRMRRGDDGDVLRRTLILSYPREKERNRAISRACAGRRRAYRALLTTGRKIAVIDSNPSGPATEPARNAMM